MAEKCKDCGNQHSGTRGAICGGTGRVWLAYVRRPYARNYSVVGLPMKSEKTALRRLTKAMLSGNYKRGMVAFADDYYDPSPTYEVVKT